MILKILFVNIVLLLFVVELESQIITFYDFNYYNFPKVEAKFKITDNYDQSYQLSDFEIIENDQICKKLSLNCSNAFSRFSIVLAIDVSSSMQHNEALIKSGFASFIESIESEHEIAMMAFNDEIQLLNDYSNNKSILHNSINNLNFSGVTNLNQIFDVSKENAIYDIATRANYTPILIIISDGIDHLKSEEIIENFKNINGSLNFLMINSLSTSDIKNIVNTTKGYVGENINTSEKLALEFNKLMNKAKSNRFCTIAWNSFYDCEDAANLQIKYIPKNLTFNTSYDKPVIKGSEQINFNLDVSEEFEIPIKAEKGSLFSNFNISSGIELLGDNIDNTILYRDTVLRFKVAFTSNDYEYLSFRVACTEYQVDISITTPFKPLIPIDNQIGKLQITKSKASRLPIVYNPNSFDIFLDSLVASDNLALTTQYGLTISALDTLFSDVEIKSKNTATDSCAVEYSFLENDYTSRIYYDGFLGKVSIDSAIVFPGEIKKLNIEIENLDIADLYSLADRMEFYFSYNPNFALFEGITSRMNKNCVQKLAVFYFAPEFFYLDFTTLFYDDLTFDVTIDSLVLFDKNNQQFNHENDYQSSQVRVKAVCDNYPPLSLDECRKFVMESIRTHNTLEINYYPIDLEVLNVRIYDLSGRKIAETVLVGDGVIRFNSEIKKGLYIIQVQTQNCLIRKRIILF